MSQSVDHRQGIVVECSGCRGQLLHSYLGDNRIRVYHNCTAKHGNLTQFAQGLGFKDGLELRAFVEKAKGERK